MLYLKKKGFNCFVDFHVFYTKTYSVQCVLSWFVFGGVEWKTNMFSCVCRFFCWLLEDQEDARIHGRPKTNKINKKQFEKHMVSAAQSLKRHTFQ
jgi:hypothetical protein